MQTRPVVSIGVPVYNGARYLGECLESLLGQSFTDLEVIVSDNASTDATETICRDFAAKDSRLRYFRNEKNLGAAPNYDRTFHLSEGRYFKWSAHDDILHPDYIARCVEVLESDPGAVGAHTWTEIIDLESKPMVFDQEQGCYFDSQGQSWHFPADTDGVGMEAPTERDSAVARFQGVIEGKRYDTVFGLYRRADMAKSCLHLPFWGSDKTFISDMALRNKIRIVPEKLFLRRCHPTQAGVLPFNEKIRWLVTDGGEKTVSPQMMALRAYNDVISSAPISAFAKLRCRIVVVKQGLRLDKWRSSSYLGVGSLLANFLHMKDGSMGARAIDKPKS
jgi:glycosyltransferase involved in cell wall biosynthesis